MKSTRYAFPCDVFTGMTLREYFAGQALIGVASLGCYNDASSIAAKAVAMADALIAELEKEPS